MVDREKEYNQIPNRITDVTTYLTIEQSLRDLERYIDSFGRTLSDNERRLQQTLPGMIQTFARISAEVQANGGKLSKSQAADLKVLLGGGKEKSILYTLNQLVKFKDGKALNDRNDQSFIHYASFFEDIMDKMSSSMSRAYREANTYLRSIDAVRQAYGISPPPIQVQTPPGGGSNTPPVVQQLQTVLSPMEEIGRRLREGLISAGEARALAQKLSMLTRHSPPKMGYGQVAFGYQPAMFPPKIRVPPKMGYGQVAFGYQPAPFPLNTHNQAAPYPPKLKKSTIALYTFAQLGDILQNIHNALKSVPIIGKITGFAAGMSKSAGSMQNAGEGLIAKFGEKSSLGKIGKILKGPIGLAIGATAFAVGAIYKQLKKSSPVLQAVTDIMSLAWNLMWMPFGNALGQYLIPLAEDMINFAIMFNELFSDFSLDKLMEVYYSGLQMIWGMLFDVSTIITTFLVDGFFSLLSDFFRSIGLDGLADFFDAIKDGIYSIRDFVRNLPTHIYEGLKNILPLLKEAFSTIVKSMPGGDMLEAATNGDLVSAGKSAWNNTIGNWTGFKLASGGVVTGPTIAMVGEAGPEAVIPLDKAGGIGATYVININGDVYGVSDLESRIERVIQRTANKSYYR